MTFSKFMSFGLVFAFAFGGLTTVATADISSKTRGMIQVKFTSESDVVRGDPKAFAGVAIVSANPKAALEGISPEEADQCIVGDNDAACEAIFGLLIKNLANLMSVSYKVNQSMALFDPTKVSYSKNLTKSYLLAARK